MVTPCPHRLRICFSPMILLGLYSLSLRTIHGSTFDAAELSVSNSSKRIWPQAAQTLFVIYRRDSIALRFKPFKRMYENGSKIALNSTCSKGFK